MNSPYRTTTQIVDVRHEAETRLIAAKAEAIAQIARGISIANSLSAGLAEGSGSYSERISALHKLFDRIERPR